MLFVCEVRCLTISKLIRDTSNLPKRAGDGLPEFSTTGTEEETFQQVEKLRFQETFQGHIFAGKKNDNCWAT